jgi:hypothetical protein
MIVVFIMSIRSDFDCCLRPAARRYVKLCAAVKCHASLITRLITLVALYGRVSITKFFAWELADVKNGNNV